MTAKDPRSKIALSDGTPIARLRLARPTDRLAEQVAFHRDLLGFVELGGFEDHEGYSGVMLGLPDETIHLEFTQHEDGSPAPPADPDALLVLYFENEAARDARANRLHAAGHRPVEPQNPYWRARALTFEDPDGWRVVLALLP